jgi:hypothetical protein
MAERQPDACVLLLDNPRLAAFSGAAAAAVAAADGGGTSGAGGGGPLDLLLRDAAGGGARGGAWRKGGGVGVEGGGGWDAVRKRYLNLFAAGRHRALVDFDEHLDDVSRDFLNAGLLAGSELLQR